MWQSPQLTVRALMALALAKRSISGQHDERERASGYDPRPYRLW